LIAVLGDTHLPRGARRLPDACLRLLEAADLILHVGDFTSAAVLEDLRAVGPVEAVHGNMDDAALREALPARRIVEADGLRIGLVHDPGPRHGRPERLRAAFPGCDVVAYGHTHVPEAVTDDGVSIVNPGSPTERRRAPSHTMAVIRSGRPELVELDR
jgi:putative phosphoesterase